MRICRPIRWMQGMLAASVLLGIALGAPAMLAQSAPPAPGSPPPGPTDNPFPGDAPKQPAAPQSQAPGSSTKPDAPTAKSKSDNPFPGEDPDAPIIPVDPVGPGANSGANPAANSGAGSSRGADANASRGADPDGDPVRSPDAPGGYGSDDGFSSSRSGMTAVPAEDDSDAPAKPVRGKSKKQLIAEDLDVGGFYLDKKNWKAAQARYSAAFALDSENPDTVWGLAEAERHLQLNKDAAEHYKLFLAYEPDGRRAREARKALDEVQSAAAPKAAVPAGSSPN